MKKLLLLLAIAILLTGCAIQKNPKREYYTINELRAIYGLTSAECKAIQNDTSIESIYHCEKGRMYKFSK